MPHNHSRLGRLFVLSAPSGSGKSAVEELVFSQLPELVYSVSYTTRGPRPGETDGRSYNFISTDKFKAMVADDQFLEWAEVFGRHYGTGRAWVESRLKAGHDVLADLDVDGAASVRRLMPEAVLIFMVPPTIGELRRRLAGRGTETEEQINLRLGRVQSEIDSRSIYDYLVINDNLNDAATEIIDIIQNGRGRPMSERENFWAEFFAKK